MSKNIKLKSIKSTYIDEIYPESNFDSKAYILSGIYYKNLSDTNSYKGLVEFNTSNLNKNNIESVYLGIYIEGLNFNYLDSVSFKISAIANNTNISNVTWNNYESELKTSPLSISIPMNYMNKFIEIDITKMFKESLDDKSFRLIMDNISYKYTSIVKFASYNSQYPPYLNIYMNEPDYSNGFENIEQTNNRYAENYFKGNKITNKNTKVVEKIINEKINELYKFAIENNKKVEELKETIQLTNEKLDYILKTQNNKSAPVGEKELIRTSETIEKLIELLKNITIETY